MSNQPPPQPAFPGLKTVAPKGLFVALAIGLAGGWVFYQLTMPLPWMIGAMVFTLAAALSGVKLVQPRRLRLVMMATLGVMLGSAFSPETLDKASAWPVTLLALMLFALLSTITATLMLIRFGGYDRVTAYFSAAPGGLNEMLFIGSSLGGDERIISLFHSTRILLTVLVIPMWYRLFEDYVPGRIVIGDITLEYGMMDGALLLFCAAAGFWGAAKLKIPAGALIGPMVLSSAVHLGGLTTLGPPSLLIVASQVVLGTAVGCRFVGYSVRRIVDVLFPACLITLSTLVLAFAFAASLAALTDFPFQALLLIFSPGGLVEMALISLALNVDVAFVSTHHLARVMLIILLAPLLFRLLDRGLMRFQKKEPEG